MAAKGDTWLEIAIAAAPSYVDELAGIVACEVGHAAAGLEIREREVVFWVTAADEVDAVTESRRLLAHLAESGAPVGDAVSVRSAPPEDEWREAYKRYFRVARLTRQVVVVPSWETYAPQQGDVVLHLDPGQAFGTGSHATTMLVLGELQRLADANYRAARSLDAGTGSGILSIAIARLGLAGELVAFDNDPIAVKAASENAAGNRVIATIECTDSPRPDHGRFELIVANIQREVLLPLADALTAAATVGGIILLSGLLVHQLDEVASAYAERGWREQHRQLDAETGEWGVLRLELAP